MMRTIRLFVPTILIALSIISTGVFFANAQSLQKGDLSLLKGKTKVFIGGGPDYQLVADMVSKDSDLTIVNSASMADFTLAIFSTDVVESSNSAGRQGTAAKAVSDIESPFVTLPNEPKAFVVGSKTALLVSTKNRSGKTVIVWNHSKIIPISRANVTAYTKNVIDPNLKSMLTGAKTSLVNDFLVSLNQL